MFWMWHEPNAFWLYFVLSESVWWECLLVTVIGSVCTYPQQVDTRTMEHECLLIYVCTCWHAQTHNRKTKQNPNGRVRLRQLWITRFLTRCMTKNAILNRWTNDGWMSVTPYWCSGWFASGYIWFSSCPTCLSFSFCVQLYNNVHSRMESVWRPWERQSFVDYTVK